MTVYQTGGSFFGDRVVDVYFKPDVDINSSKEFCLELEFTAFHYFSVNLVYVVESRYNERPLFRSMTSLGDRLRLLKNDVRPWMTQHQQFFVVIRIRSSDIGQMAIIKRLSVLSHRCLQQGTAHVGLI